MYKHGKNIELVDWLVVSCHQGPIQIHASLIRDIAACSEADESQYHARRLDISA